MHYPISLLEPIQYWEKKNTFKFEHSRVGIWKMVAIESGRLSFQIEQISGTAQSGDILICPPNIVFYRKVIEPISFFYCSFRYSNINFIQEQQMIQLLFQSFGYKFTPIERDRLFNNYHQLIEFTQKQGSDQNYWTTHYINDVWMLFCKEAKYKDSAQGWVHDPVIEKAKKWIEKHAFKDVHLKDIADLLNLHPSQLSRRFQTSVGMTPSRYLLSIRMEKAKSLLIQTDYTLDHIAQLCGYENGFYFSRKFTQFLNMNPSSFRTLRNSSNPTVNQQDLPESFSDETK